MSIILMRSFEANQPSKFIEALNAHNDAHNRKNVAMGQNLAKPSLIIIGGVYESLAEQQVQALENKKAMESGLMDRAGSPKLLDQGFFNMEVTNDPDRTLMGKTKYVVMTGGPVKIGAVANAVEIARRIEAKIGPDQLKNGISSSLLRPLTGVPMNRVIHRVGLPSLEAAEQFISTSPGDWPADVAEDLREWISNFTQLNRGLFEVVRSFG